MPAKLVWLRQPGAVPPVAASLAAGSPSPDCTGGLQECQLEGRRAGMATIRVGSVSLYFQTWGAGDPLMMVHGLGMSSELWRH